MANDDVTPGLYAEINSKLENSIQNDKTIQKIMARAADGKSNRYDLDNYAKRLGKHTSKALMDTLTEENLPDGTLYYHIANGTAGKVIKDNYKRVNALGADVQISLNRFANIGLNAVKPKMNTERSSGLIDKMAHETFLDDARTWLAEPIINITQSMAVDFMKTNMDFQYKSGLSPMITREASDKCCEWCADLEGVYEYGTQPEDFFRRHDYCRCSITYDPRKGDGKVQDSWSKEWMSADEAAKREERKTYGMERTWVKDDTGRYRRS